MMNRLAGLAAIALLSASPVGAQFSQEADVVAVPVAEGLHMFMAAGGNIGVLSGDDGVVLIDDQYAPMVPRIKAAAAELSDAPIRMVMNTHWHGDHTGGNEQFGSEGAVIIAHDNVRRRMSASHFSRFFDAEIPPSPPAALPVVTFATDITVHLNGQTVYVEHVPAAHTDGDSIVWFKERNAVHMGDIFFNELYPFIDLSSGGDVRGMLRAAESVLLRIDGDTKVMPGHGQLTDKAGLARYVALLRTVIQRVEALVADGASLEDAQAAKPTAEFDEVWGKAFIEPDAWVGIVYEGLAGSE